MFIQFYYSLYFWYAVSMKFVIITVYLLKSTNEIFYKFVFKTCVCIEHLCELSDRLRTDYINTLV